MENQNTKSKITDENLKVDIQSTDQNIEIPKDSTKGITYENAYSVELFKKLRYNFLYNKAFDIPHLDHPSNQYGRFESLIPRQFLTDQVKKDINNSIQSSKIAINTLRQRKELAQVYYGQDENGNFIFKEGIKNTTEINRINREINKLNSNVEKSATPEVLVELTKLQKN